MEVTFQASGSLVEFEGEDKGKVSIRAYNGGKLRLGNFRHPVVIDTNSVQLHGNAEQQPLLRDHMQDKVVGHGTPEVVRGSHLEVEGRLSVPGEERDKIQAAAKGGFQWQASVGGSIADVRKDVRLIAAGKPVSVNGRTHIGPLHLVGNFVWKETSIVALGADEERATAQVAASQGKRQILMNEFEKWLQACGLNHEELDDAQLGELKAAFEAKTKPAPAPAPAAPVAAAAPAVVTASADSGASSVSAIRAEHARLGRIDRIAATMGRGLDANKVEEIRASAIAEEISEDKMQLMLLQASRDSHGNVSNHAGSSQPENIALILEAAICRTAGISEDQIEAGLKINASAGDVDRAMNESARSRYNSVGIAHLIYAACAQAGHSITPGSKVQNEDIQAALEHSRNVRGASAMSTISVPGILSRVANKAMLAAYADVPGVILDVAVRETASDFKKFDRYRMTEVGTMELVPATGRIPHGTATEETYENKVNTYGKMFNLTRQMQRNDDLGAFLQIPRMLGRMGRTSLEEAGMTMIANLSTTAGAGTNEFFHGADREGENANYIEGASSAFGLDALGLAYALFLDQVDSSGKPIMVEPDRVLVCSGDYVAARKIYSDTELRNPLDRETTGNEWQGMFQPLKSPWLGRVGSTPNPDQWYMLPNPATGMGIIAVAFLDGRDTPIVEQGSVDFDQLGVGYRGYFDFGIGEMDARCGVKSKGKA